MAEVFKVRETEVYFAEKPDVKFPAFRIVKVEDGVEFDRGMVFHQKELADVVAMVLSTYSMEDLMAKASSMMVDSLSAEVD